MAKWELVWPKLPEGLTVFEWKFFHQWLKCGTRRFVSVLCSCNVGPLSIDLQKIKDSEKKLKSMKSGLVNFEAMV
jgi:hypothetical protein